MKTIDSTFDAGRNAFDPLRLVLAGLVAVMHGFSVGYGWQPAFPAGVHASTLGVDGFFVLSGFLVARSFVRLKSPARFVWHRFLRIMPGFWACLVVVALVFTPLAAVIEGRPLGPVLWGSGSLSSYIPANVALAIFQPRIDGLYTDTWVDGNVNGSLWSLAFEAACYGLVVVLGLLGALTARRGVVLAIGAGLWGLAILVWLTGVSVPLFAALTLELVLLFVLGTLAYLYADHIPMNGWLAALAVGVLAVSLVWVPDYRATGAPAFAYLLLYVGVRVRLPFRIRHDVSYGVYIYHWPVLLTLAILGVARSAPVAYALAGVVGTLLLATASWFVVERPAMARRHSSVPDRVAALSRRGRASEPASTVEQA